MDRLVALPLGKSVEIAFNSLRVRFYRSLITTMSLVLAVAFLCYVSAGVDLVEALAGSGDPDVLARLIRAGYDISPDAGAISAGARQRWIVFLSLLVCTVGIVNAQLMAVTERFREVGTMKCLGALDRFILRLFLLEALMQGLAGALAGALLGLGGAVVGAALAYGGQVLGLLPWAALAQSAAWAVGTGCFLSLLGVIYPAIIAARMRPVEAMRAEE